MLGPSIPTYEEATSSRSLSRNGAGHTGEAEERAGLLGQQSSSNYRHPTVEDARDSEDRELVQFEVTDPPTENQQSTSRRAYHQFQKRLSTLASSVSSSLPRFRFPKLSFPFRWSRLPSISFIKFFEFFLPYYRLFIVFFVIIIVYALLASDLFNFQARTILGQVFDPASVQNYAINHVRIEKIQHHLEYLTKFGHVAGTDGDRVLGEYIEEELISFGMDMVETKDYYVYLNYPKQGGRHISIVQPKNLAWQMNIEDLQAQGTFQPPHVFHGYGASGDVTGRLLYAGYGRPEDYVTLQSKGVNFTGAIVLVRQSGANLDTGMIVRTAEKAGAIGCLISSGNWDVPIDQDLGGGDMIVRGSVSLMSQVMGDVLTPGYASTKDAVMLSKKGNAGLVNIPSLPISRSNAIYLLKILEGLGVPLKVDAGNKSQLLPLWTGNASSPVVRLQNQLVDKDKQRITNVLATIKGTEKSEQKLIIGNHRDAWCWGASSPNSGTAVMLEVARLFGEMMTFGWRPLRTIIFANWDAGEYNRVGSTEWVEDHTRDLRHNGVAYINLGTAFSGESFQASGSPALETVLLKVLSRISDPKSKVSLLELWEKKFPGLGAAGDYGAFQHFAGMASIDIGFRGTGNSVVNSCYDTYSLLTQRDPNLDYPYTMAQILSLLILELADSSNMPFNMTNYASHASSWLSDLEAHVNMKAFNGGNQRKSLDLTSLRDAVELMRRNMPLFDNKVAEWTDDDGDFSADLDSTVSTVHRISHNVRMANFEHHLIIDEGLWGRQWFKHVLMAPKKENAYEVEYFPSIRDAVDAENWEAAQENVYKVAQKLKAATDKILN